jgi:hypothetical protein
MTSAVATGAESSAARQLKTHIDVASIMGAMSRTQLAGSFAPALAGRLASPRFRKRLERRYLRCSGALKALPVLAEGQASDIVALGSDGLLSLIVDTGVVCHYAALRQIVDRSSIERLSRLVGHPLAEHEARYEGRSASLDLARQIGAYAPADIEGLAAAIFRDGFQAWSCWTHRQDEAVLDFYRMLTPAFPTNVTVQEIDGCRKRDCSLRAALFETRLALVGQSHDTPLREEA